MFEHLKTFVKEYNIDNKLSEDGIDNDNNTCTCKTIVSYIDNNVVNDMISQNLNNLIKDLTGKKRDVLIKNISLNQIIKECKINIKNSYTLVKNYNS